ncbi:MAG: S26 family signal peptidase [Phycisphaerales bacterium]|nr:MAG: S26 family signal peptidase [Phycisphaerales bacterium]
MSSTTGARADHAASSIKDTITSIVIAFTMAFVFRGFVVEAFVIPTGSMAPTLMGAHMRFHGEDSGYAWQVGPWHYGPRNVPLPIQGASPLINRGARDARGIQITPIEVADPMSGRRVTGPASRDVPCLAGDRIFVVKYLQPFFAPDRWDVAVFKNPTAPQENFIKRLVAMPGEQVALVDGDVFVREAPDGQAAGWDAGDWRIARKDERTQRAVWQPVFDSGYEPLQGAAMFASPWRPSGPGWTMDRRRYTFRGEGEASLAWHAAGRRTTPFPGRIPAEVATWAVNDFYPYNENTSSSFGGVDVFPVSDVRLSFAIEPDAGVAVSVTAELDARGHEFRASIETGGDGRGEAVIFKRRAGAGEWTELAREPLTRAITPGRTTNVEFWHADQSLSLWIEGRRVAEALYDWSPAERISAATGRGFARLLAEDRERMFSHLRDPSIYERPELRWRFDVARASGAGAEAGFALYRVRLDRDLFFQPGVYRPTSGHSLAGEPMIATHPTENPLVLTNEQFFTLGDNSPASSDGRAWDEPDPWVATLIDPTPGVVHQRLMIGKAFFVYFPAPHSLAGRSIIPDFGRLRFIW